MPKLRIVGFDPASVRNLGWAFVAIEDNGDFEISAGTLVLERVDEPWKALWPMFSFVSTFIEEQKPNLIIVEKTSSFSGSFVTGQVSNCLGCILAACGKHAVDVNFMFPSHVKKVIVGKGKATKTEMRRSVTNILERLTNEKVGFDSEHSYDAVANILCWLSDNKYLPSENDDDDKDDKGHTVS